MPEGRLTIGRRLPTCPTKSSRPVRANMRLPLVLLCATVVSAQSWIPQVSGTTASLRGVSAVNAQVVWASGTGGIYLITRDGGATWRAGQVPGAEKMDFRAVWAFDDGAAFLLSIGNGDQSRIY